MLVTDPSDGAVTAATLNVTLVVPVPPVFVAASVTVDEPDEVGVPLITPLVVSKLNPAGRVPAEILHDVTGPPVFVGALRVKASPCVKDWVETAASAGATSTTLMLKVKTAEVPDWLSAVNETLDEVVIVVGVPLSTH